MSNGLMRDRTRRCDGQARAREKRNFLKKMIGARRGSSLTRDWQKYSDGPAGR
jgi:hypothetical protein